MSISGAFSMDFSEAFDPPGTGEDAPPLPVYPSSYAGSCQWPVDYSICGTCTALTSLPPEQQILFEQMASDMLWNWTNRVFGVCPVGLRPCKSECAQDWMTTFWGRGPYPWMGSADQGSWVPFLHAGKWYNITCGCAGACTCSVEGPTSVSLPGPISKIEQVTIDGSVLSPNAYRVMYNRYLVRTDGGTWPACQDLLLPSDQFGTFEVQYLKGIPVPVGGQLAAGLLACELAKAYNNDTTCQLPQRIQNITREGVSVTLMDDFNDLKAGSTGIWAIDSWTASVNMPRPFASVRSVDVPQKMGVYPRG